MLTTPAVSCLLTMCIFNGCDDISNHLVSRLLGGIYLKKTYLEINLATQAKDQHQIQSVHGTGRTKIIICL